MATPRATVIAVALAAPLACALALALGSVRLPFGEWLAALAGGGADTTREIVWGLRAPRAAAAFGAGALLAIAGTLLQVLLRNPLADPYLLGVSGGASVGALAAIALGATAFGIDAAAFAGACAAAGALLAFSLAWRGWTVHRVLLTGVAIAAGCGAIVSLFLTLAPAAQVKGMLFWLMGDLSGARPPVGTLVVLAIVLALSLALSRSLDALELGAAKARTLGVDAGRVQALAFLAATLATVAAVMQCGAVGFVGLVVPHLLRLAGATRHAALLPLSALGGGALLTLADTGARTVVAPIEIPVGAVTALVGVPLLLVLLARTR